MNRLHVIGIGSPFGADRLGWDAVEQLQHSEFEQRCHPVQVTYSRCASPAQLPGVLANPGAVAIIDAVAGQSPGRVCRLALEDIEAQDTITSSHGIGLSDALGVTRQLYGLPGDMVIIGIGMDPADDRIEAASAQTMSDVEGALLAFIHAT